LIEVPRPSLLRCVACMTAVLAITGIGCRRDMQDQPRYEPFGRSSFFADHRQARPLPEGTVARGHLNADTYFHLGKTEDGKMVPAFPATVTIDVLRRGRQRYGIYCTPCHGETGTGNGMIVQRGFPKPTSFHDQRLLDADPGYFFNAITNGFGVMPSYAVQVPVEDRWAIVAYIDALQLSRNASIKDVPAERRAELVESSTNTDGVSALGGSGGGTHD
jgi:mono/diheme cytochrome c family protein